MAIATFTKTGNKAASAAKLDKNVFGVTPENHELVKAAYVAYLANGRQSAGKAKTRGEVSGGGRKPWRQKGTGRARFGSIRNPIWRGGGIVFGPTGEENYTHKLPTAAKRKAIRQALSMAADSGKVLVIEAFQPKEAKTAVAAKLLSKIGATGSTLLVVEDKTADIIRSTGNLPHVTVVHAQYVNVFDVMNAGHVVVTTKALDILSEWLGGKK